MAWQDKARALLATPELATSLRQVGNRAEGAEEKSGAVELISLAAETVEQLDDLMVEGNLLEVSQFFYLLLADTNLTELKVSLDEKHSIRQLLQAAPSRETWKHPKVELREEKESQEGEKLMDRRRGMSAEEEEVEVEKQLVNVVADETDICSAKRPKCKYPTGEQVGAVKSLRSNFTQKLCQIFFGRQMIILVCKGVKLHIAY